MVSAVDMLVVHGMEEVSGSSPFSFHPGQMHNSNQKPVSVRPVRGILRGKIHRTMAVWPAVTQALSSLPDEQRLCDLQEVTSPGAALCPGAAGQAACCEVRGSRLVPPGER
jgi:hypothetical protein